MTKEPKYSCPHLDDAISAADQAANTVRHEIEKARSIHEELREWGREWEVEARRLESKLSDVTDERDKLDQENSELRSQIEKLERALAQAEAEIIEHSNYVQVTA
jgi:chromosome segregation ATPase